MENKSVQAFIELARIEREWLLSAVGGAEGCMCRFTGDFHEATIESVNHSALVRARIELWEIDVEKYEKHGLVSDAYVKPDPQTNCRIALWAVISVPQSSPARIAVRGSQD